MPALSGGPVLYAELSASWPEEPLPNLDLPASQLLTELTHLWPLLAEAVAATGPGCLWSIRWDQDERWQVLSVPPLGTTSLPVPEIPGSRERDAWTVISALLSVVVDRMPRDIDDAQGLLELHAGVTHGLDAILHALLRSPRTGLTDAERVHAAVRVTSAGPVSIWTAAETAVGSAKAKYDPEFDNEDAYAVAHTPDGASILIVCDGVTGSGDGSGARASRAAVRELKSLLADGCDPGLAITSAGRAVSRETTGATTALVVRISTDGRAELLSIGDSPAWVVRRGTDGERIAFRLTPDQTVLAEARRTDPDATHGASQLAQFLGGGGKDAAAQPYRGTLRVATGDLVVLLSDGAAIPDTEWFGSELAALAEEFPTAPRLAAALIARAEQLGGQDNATAVIAEVRASQLRSEPNPEVPESL
ncbi:PP2C family protein-serine/threonine phosphatase [Nocardia niigatensis]